MAQLQQLAQLSQQVYGFDKTTTTHNDHIALYQSFGKLKSDIAGIAEQLRSDAAQQEEQRRLQQQLLDQQRQQQLLQQQQQQLQQDKERLEQQLRAQREQQLAQQQQLEHELAAQREQQAKLLALQQQREQQQRAEHEQQLQLEQQQREQQAQLLAEQQRQQREQQQQLEQQLREQREHELRLQAEQEDLQRRLLEQQQAAEKAAREAAQAAQDETDKRLEQQRETLLSVAQSAAVTQPVPLAEPPRFVRPIEDACVQEGDPIELICVVTGQQPLTIEWLKDTYSIDGPNSGYSTVFDGAQCTLTIAEAITADSARFTCRASNAAGKTETTGVLLVREPPPLVMLESPQFARQLQSGRAREGETFEFGCLVTGNPLPTVQWFKNDVCVDQLKDFAITFNNGEARLRLDEVFLEDQAVFTCRATNPYGTEASSALLTVDREYYLPNLINYAFHNKICPLKFLLVQRY